ncbi:DUF1217 domain-containing protein [Azospirillum halopraeferens]|uniref:DUF1217 domain-containing protein n=1 Tax=Azospirillum halopraeferens TaxID=34010 RepID=UPI00040A5E98|nr:DUF1217 domain-containing protein [Azospirillum halopraeferens]
MSTVLDLRRMTANHDRYDQMIRRRPAEQRAIADFRERIGTITSVDAFLKDDKLYRFVMEAFDLGSQIYAKGLIRRVLTEGVTDKASTANRMNDVKFKELATVLGFAESGGANLKEPKIVQAIVDRYVSVRLEVESEDTNPAVRLGLYFKRRAPAITNWYQVMADPALREVVLTILDLPKQTALLDVDRQKEIFSRRLDIADFRNPDKVRALLDRFGAMHDARNGAASDTAAVAPMIGLRRGSRPSIVAIDPSVTLTLLKFPRF